VAFSQAIGDRLVFMPGIFGQSQWRNSCSRTRSDPSEVPCFELVPETI